MATRKYVTHIDLQKNELQNAVIQNLSTAPSNPKAGQVYYNTVDKLLYTYDGTKWVAGKVYTEGNGIDITNDVISIDNAVTAATKCKITYNAQGLVIGGTDLSSSDIPDISATYVTQAEKGVANGVASLGSDGKVPSAQLPSFVDDVIDAYIVTGATALSSGWLSATDGGAALTPETGKIYVVLTVGEYLNKTYRWSGSTYVEISASPAQATESTAGIARIATSAQVSAGSDDTTIVTPLKLAGAISDVARKATFTNSALTASGGQVTWTITTSVAPDCIVSVRETSGGAEVYADVTYGSGSITIKMNSASNISAGTYTAVVLG